MEVLQYSDLDISRVADAFERVVGHLRAGDFRAADVKTELARIALHHLGIVRLEPAEDQPTRITADLYCEEMVLMPGGMP